jgi:hypothetical protein
MPKQYPATQKYNNDALPLLQIKLPRLQFRDTQEVLVPVIRYPGRPYSPRFLRCVHEMHFFCESPCAARYTYARYVRRYAVKPM